MNKLFFPSLLAFLVLGSCSSKKSDKPFCEAGCMNDTLKFNTTIKLEPYVYITARDCKPDSLIWSYQGMGINRKMGFTDLVGTEISFSKNKFRCEIPDTSYAWLIFNDCATGRGFQLKLPFDKSRNIGRKSSGINNLDPKFSIDPSLVAFTDRGNIYVEEIATGKAAMMTFGKNIADLDYDKIHDHIDSVSVTPTRIWVKVKVDGEWVEKEKNISLE